MSKKNNVSIRALDKVLKSFKPDDAVRIVRYEVENTVVEIEVRRYISLQEANDFVDVVVSGAFQSDSDGAESYSFIMRQYAWNLAILTYFTNIKPDIGADRLYTIIYDTNIMSRITECIVSKQLEDLNSAVESGVKYMSSIAASTQSYKTSELMRKVDYLLSAISITSNAMKDISDEKIHTAINKLADMDEDSVIRVLTKDSFGDADGEVN